MSQALVLVAHGSHLNPDSSTPTYDHADTIRATGVFDEVATGFWKEEPSLREVLRTVESDEVYVVPLFISEGYFTEQVIPRELRLDGWDVEDWDSDGLSADVATYEAEDTGQTVHYCGPIGTHRTMTDVLIRRAETVTGDPNVGEGFGFAVVGHGTERNENSAKAIEYHADRVRETGRFEEVQALYMDEDPEVDDVTDFFETEDIVVVPLFLSDGFHTQEDIPEDMGLTDDYRDGYDVPADVDGHRIWYAGAVGTEPLTADVALERAADAGANVGSAVAEVREATRVAQAESEAATESEAETEAEAEAEAETEAEAEAKTESDDTTRTEADD
jgi:sirohydrochlorin cobaltochelatase